MGDYEVNLRQCLEKGLETFLSKYGGEPVVAVSAPGRVNLIGEHTDYNDGFVLPMALPLMTVMVGRRSKSSECSVVSTAVDEEVSCQQFSVPDYPGPGDEVVSTEGPLWIKYVKGVVALMNQSGDVPAFEAVITSCVPLGGGLSSSASLEMATGLFVEQLLGRELPRKELALTCQKAEHRYAGNKCGIMDQFISAMAEEGKALKIDCRDLSCDSFPLNPPDLVVLVMDTGKRHALAGGEYNKRREACGRAAATLNVTSLRSASMGKLEECKDGLSDNDFRRARHVISEIERTEQAAIALRDNDYVTFGKLMNKSHDSLRDDYDVSCPELDKLVDLAREGSGVYGSRMTGGGFGGCTVTLLHRQVVEDTISRIQEGYHEATNFKYRDEFQVYKATASRGAGVISLSPKK